MFWPITFLRVEEDRQRKDKDISDLLPSIKARGIITPLIIEKDPDDSNYAFLRAGERRLLCAKELGLTEVPVRLLSDLTPIERQIIELEENLHRKSLSWQELVLSVERIHEMYSRINPSWPQEKTGEMIAYSPKSISQMLAVAKEVRQQNPRILAASGWSGAYNILSRLNIRRADDAFNELMEEPDVLEEDKSIPLQGGNRTSSIDPIEGASSDQLGTKGLPSQLSEPILPIRKADFREWAPNYRGPLFQFVHCDFPYGIGLDKSAQGNTATWGGYEDSERTYWELIKSLCDNIEKIMAPSSHLMFWLSADWDTVGHTIMHFENNTDLKFNSKPLIWHKSDNRGILPDPKRGPRHVYETAIFASRGDRFINQAVSDAYSSPAGEKSHQSEKAEAMLRHFFRMFIDEGTRMLDPTCGAGSSLRAADSLGATVTGFDLDPEHVETGNQLFRKHLNLKRYSK